MKNIYFGFMVGITTGIILTMGLGFKYNYQPGQTIVNKGCAEYDTNTGKFQWVIKK